jgi:small subunit ribosomal protein S5e
MSDSGEEVQTGNLPLPKEVTAEVGGTKLFNKWCVMTIGGYMSLIQSRSYDEVEVRDISLTDYINIRSPVYIPHSAGRYAVKRFRKAQVWILEYTDCANY